MRLLTWHGTIIRLEAATGRLLHSRLVPTRDLAADFILALPPEGLIAPLAGPNEITLVPGRKAGTAHLQRRGLFLSVQSGPAPLFTAAAPGTSETLTLIPDDAAALLRDLLTHAWTRADTGAAIRPQDMTVGEGPALTAAGLTFALGQDVIRPGDTPDTLTLAGAPPLMLTRVPGSRMQPREIKLRRREGAPSPAVADAAAFATRSPARLIEPGAAELAIPPILGSLADRDFLYRRGLGGRPPACGRLQLRNRMARAGGCFVLLDRGAEGTILDRDGVVQDAGTIEDTPPSLGREGDQYFIDAALLDNAPSLSGPHAVFYGGGIADISQWLIGAMVPLSLLAPYLPEDVTLLLPGHCGPDHLALLEAFGFGDMKRRVAADPICRVEALYWPESRAIDQIPAAALRAARDRALAHRPPAPGPRTRIYVRRAGTRGVSHPRILESVMERYGITPVRLEELSVVERIDLFSRAEIVVAAHGGALANLVFCPVGTKVIELSPDCQYRPVFNEICAKLGLSHAVLPCATDDGTFDGRMAVPAPRLNTLLGLIMSRRAAA